MFQPCMMKKPSAMRRGMCAASSSQLRTRAAIDQAKRIFRKIQTSVAIKKNSEVLREIPKLGLSGSEIEELDLVDQISAWVERKKVYRSAANDVLTLLALKKLTPLAPKKSVKRKAPCEEVQRPAKKV
uniref:LETM1 domain-containing protein n=1 Tax=Steinernema glaseri TaxID=37863 RepID=A0A1I8ABD1_9BILA